MRDRRGLAEQVARRAELLDHGLLRRERRLAGELGVRGTSGLRRDRVGCLGDDPSVEADDGAIGQVELAPPHDVGHVAERADHRDAGALVLLGEVVCDHGDLDPEHGGRHRRAEQRLVALVVGVRDEGDARGDELGAARLDLDRAAVGAVEGDAVVVPGLLAVLELGLRHGGAEGHVPQRRRQRLVGLAALHVADERELRREERLVGDGAVRLLPVHREAELAEQGLELLLVLDGEALAQLDEVATADRLLVGGLRALVVAALEGRHEVGVVRQRGVAPHAVVVLHAALGGQAVVVPAHRVEHVSAAHALVAGDEVGVREREHVADVQRARRGRRRRVDRVDRLAGRTGTIEPVGALALPRVAPDRFESLERGLVGNAGVVGHDAPVRYRRHRVHTEVPECATIQPIGDDSARRKPAGRVRCPLAERTVGMTLRRRMPARASPRRRGRRPRGPAASAMRPRPRPG